MSTSNLEHNEHTNFSDNINKATENSSPANSQSSSTVIRTTSALTIFADLIDHAHNDADKIQHKIKLLALDEYKHADEALKNLHLSGFEIAHTEHDHCNDTEKNPQLLAEIKLLCKMTMLIPEKERNAASKDFLIFFKNLDHKESNLTSTSELAYQILLKAAPEQRGIILRVASASIKDTDNKDQRLHLLTTLASVSPNELTAFCQLASPNMAHIKDSNTCCRIFEALISVPKSLREETFEIMAPHIKDLAAGSRPIAGAYQSLVSFVIESKKITYFTRPRQYAELCRLAWPLLADIAANTATPPSSLYKPVLNTLYEIEPKEREDFCRLIQPILKTIDDPAEYAAFFDFIYLIPLEQRKDVIKDLTAHGTGIYQDLAEGLRFIPLEDRSAAIQPLLYLFEDAISVEKAHCFQSLRNISPDCRGKVFEVAASLAQFVKDNRDEVFRGVINFPMRHLDYLHGYVKEVLHKFNYDNEDQFLSFLELLSEIPADSIEDISKLAFSFFDQTKRVDGNMYNSLLHTLANIQKNDAADLIKFIQPLIKGIDSGYDRIKILQAFKPIPHKQREEIYQSAQPFFANITYSGSQQAVLYAIIKSIPPEHRNALFQIAAPLLENIKQGDQANLILEALKAFPHEQRIDLPNLMAPYAKEITTHSFAADLLKTLRLFPPEERKIALELSFSLINELQGAYVLVPSVMKTLNQIPDDEIKEIVAVIKDKYALEFKAQFNHIIPALALIPGQQRINSIDAIKSLLKMKPEIYLCALEMLNFVAPAQRLPTLIDLLKDCAKLVSPGDSRYDMCRKLLSYFFEDEKIQADSYAHLMEMLDKCLIDRHAAARLAKNIYDNQEPLLLHDEHPLFQRALEVLSLTDRNTAHPKNPYTLYQQLKDILHAEKLIQTGPDTALTIEIHGKQHRIGVALNLEGFRKHAVNKGFTFGNLPSGVSESSFESLFSALETRLQALPATDKKQAEDEIYALCGDTQLAQLKSETIGFGKEIPKLLKAKGGKHDPVSNTIFYLYTILTAIYSESNQCKQGELLSPQELMFLKFLSQIKECSIGQKDGIALYYNYSIPVKFHQGNAAVSAVEKIESCLDQGIQAILNETFTSEEMLKEIGGQAVVQQAHHTLYLKNRYSYQLGLLHNLSFDPYANVIADGFIDCTETIDPDKGLGKAALQALKTILLHISPEYIMKRTKKGIADALKAGIIKYDNLATYLEQSGIKKDDDDWLDFIEYSLGIDGEPDYAKLLGITDSATLAILIKTGYFIQKKD